MSTILRVDSPVSNIIYVPHVRPPRLPWRKCRDIFVGQHMTRHKKKATVRPLPYTGNSSFQLATQECYEISCAKMLPVLLDLNGFVFQIINICLQNQQSV